jgi:glycosyltransferase involved in cell wall biosynthesis/Flp pilus assembly protein TadD
VSLSLCIVVKNEASFVGPCMASARAICDEVVVVDTGSTDGTQETARRAGARVFEEPWPGDLGRAHDLPVERAGGDWILTLDADEVLDPAGLEEIPRLVGGGEHEGWLFRFRNYLRAPGVCWRWADARDPLTRGACGWTPSRTVRLFRNRPSYRNRGLLHHSVAPAIVEAGGSLGRAATDVHHYGFLRGDRIKGGAYLRLARRQALGAPENPQSWLELGIVLQQHRDPARRSAAADAFRRARANGLAGAGAYFLGIALLELARPTAALAAFEEALAAPPTDPAFFEAADAWSARGDALEALGRVEEAIASHRRALEERPDSPIALNNLAGLLAEHGRPDQAVELASALVARVPELEMAWATLGRAHAARGDWHSARDALEAAVEVRPFNGIALSNLAIVRYRLGDRAGARALWASAKGYREAERRRRLASEEDPEPAPRPVRRSRQGRGLIVTLARSLGGGAGRALANVVRALADDFDHLVLLGNRGEVTGFGIPGELHRLGAAVECAWSERQVTRILEAERPAAVVQHLLTPLLAAPHRVDGEPWIAAGHSSQPLPLGFDRYVLLSDHHERIQGHVPAALRRRIPNCVDLQAFAQTRPPPAGPVQVAMLSRLEPGKFPRRLLEHLPALDRLGAQVVIAGLGVRRLQIEPEVRARGWGDVVRFLGPVEHARVPGLLAGAGIGLHLTEIDAEIHSIAVLEMMAAALPVVSQPRGCLPELVEPGANGFLGESEAETREALERLIRDRELRRRMGRASRERVARFDWPRFAESWRALIAEALEGGRWEDAVSRPAAGELTRDDGAAGLPGWPASRTLILCGGGGKAVRLARLLGESGVVAEPQRCLEPRALRAAAGAFGVSGLRATLRALMEDRTPPSGVFALRVEDGDLIELDRQSGGSATAGARRLQHAVPAPTWCLLEPGGTGADTWAAVFQALGVLPLAVDVEDLGAARARILDALGLAAAV